MNDIQRKRTKRFANFLAKIPPKQFNIEYICCNREGEFSIPGKCGTVACAIGHLPLFNRKFRYYNNNPCYKYDYSVGYYDDGFISNYHIMNRYFGFEYKEIDFIFYPEGWDCDKVTPKMVAKRINDYLLGNSSFYKKYIDYLEKYKGL